MHILTPEETRGARWSDDYFRQPLVSLQSRSESFLEKGQIPIIVDRQSCCNMEINKHQFLVPADKPLAEFMSYVRSGWTAADAQKGLHMLVSGPNGSIMISPSQIAGVVHAQNKGTNGFLFVEFMEENTFG